MAIHPDPVSSSRIKVARRRRPVVGAEVIDTREVLPFLGEGAAVLLPQVEGRRAFQSKPKEATLVCARGSLDVRMPAAAAWQPATPAAQVRARRTISTSDPGLRFASVQFGDVNPAAS